MAAKFEDGPSEVNVHVVGSTFADNYWGISCWGQSARKSINVTLENHTIIGLGPLENIECAGIFISSGVGGRIAGNTISGYAYVGTEPVFPMSFGILAANEADCPPFGILQPLTIEGNTFRDNQWQIALVKGHNSVVRNNRFQGTAPGIIPVGLAVTGTNVTIASNQFENMAEGIRLMGIDPTFGTILGSAVDAQVTSNRFCNVTTNVTVQPLASATQAGTFVCPFPFPTLAMANAVMLSWPNYADGWTLESSPDLQGPWTPLDVAPSVQDGQYVFAVLTTGQQRFFRLRRP